MVTLKKFSFGSGFLEWVEAVLKNQQLFVINADREKPYFKLEKQHAQETQFVLIFLFLPHDKNKSEYRGGRYQ